jgi:tetratricopeptide (TPR) repeat protein
VRAMVATLFGSKRNIALVAGGALLLVIVIAFATGGSKDKPNAVASKTETTKKTPAIEPAPDKAPEEKVTETPAVDHEKVAAVESTTPTETPAETPTETPATGSDTAAADPPPSAGSAATPATGTPKTPATGTGTAKVVTGGKAPTTSGSKKTLGGKQVVLEYDAQAKETAKPVATAPKNDQAAILKARASYAQGNQKLMAGDWDGAILKYRQSLANYPGYVAGYRGLGLAFAQKGDKPKALQALRLYLSSVPGAKDAGLIKKRIDTLQR